MSTLTLQTIQDGARNAIIKGTIVGDATDLTDAILVNVSALVNAPSDVKIVRIQSSFMTFSGILDWDATANVVIDHLPQNEPKDMCYRRYGGLQNNAGAGKTGDILLSTLGIAAGQDGTVIIHVQKS